MVFSYIMSLYGSLRGDDNLQSTFKDIFGLMFKITRWRGSYVTMSNEGSFGF